MTRNGPAATTIDVRTRPAPGGISIALLAIAAIAFLALFKENPHCTQEVSFLLAVFEMENHPEDKGWNGPPLVYQAPLAWPLRSALGLLAVSALFMPAIIALTSRGGTIRQARAGLILVTATVAPAIASAVPREIIGERFQELLRATALCSLLLLAAALLTVARICRWRARRHRDLAESIGGSSHVLSRTGEDRE
jgi:hypothetical protein